MRSKHDSETSAGTDPRVERFRLTIIPHFIRRYAPLCATSARRTGTTFVLRVVGTNQTCGDTTTLFFVTRNPSRRSNSFCDVPSKLCLRVPS